jgi:hypothetical protein
LLALNCNVICITSKETGPNPSGEISGSRGAKYEDSFWVVAPRETQILHGGSMYLRNVGICLKLHKTLHGRKSTPRTRCMLSLLHINSYLTPRSTSFLKANRSLVGQYVTASYGNLMFITVTTITRHWTLNCTKWIWLKFIVRFSPLSSTLLVPPTFLLKFMTFSMPW